MAYAAAFEEFSKNHQYGVGGLSPTASRTWSRRASRGSTIRRSCAPPMTSAFVNWSATRRSRVRTIRRPTPATTTRRFPSCSSIPRRATDLYFNVSQPSEWIAEYGALQSGTFSYEQIIADESEAWSATCCAARTIRGCSTRRTFATSAAAQSLFTDLLDAVLAKYKARATFPVVSPTMDELAWKVKARMALERVGRRSRRSSPAGS